MRGLPQHAAEGPGRHADRARRAGRFERPCTPSRWEKVILKLRAGLMPPMGMPRPDRAAIDGLASWLEREIDRAAARNPNPGRTEPLHRLNRAEYQNAVRDLLHLETDVATLLPADDVSSGFDNIASALTISPTLMDRYLTAAQKIARLALGTPTTVPNVDYFRLADDLRQDDHLPGMPFGTRGGTRIRYTFPVDGEYVIRVRLARDLNESMPPYADPQQLEVSLDGEQLEVFTLAAAAPAAGRGRGAAPQQAPSQPRRHATAPARPLPRRPASRCAATAAASGSSASAGSCATHAIGARAAQSGRSELGRPCSGESRRARDCRRVSEEDRRGRRNATAAVPAPVSGGQQRPGDAHGAALQSVEISGPHATTGCRRYAESSPDFRAGPAGSEPSQRSCARTILSTLTRRAYRRPVTDADLQPLLTLYGEGHEQGGFEAGIERALKRLLVSP